MLYQFFTKTIFVEDYKQKKGTYIELKNLLQYNFQSNIVLLNKFKRTKFVFSSIMLSIFNTYLLYY